jgi:two-component system, OmpR family, sensor histidine kinase BaeS
MKIQTKLFSILFVFSLLLVVAVVLVTQRSIDQGMIDYVNKKELNLLKQYAPEFVAIYKTEDGWHTLKDNHEWFQRTLRKAQNAQRLAELNITDGEVYQRSNEFKPPRPLARENTEVNGRRAPPREPNVSFALLDKNKQLVVGHFPSQREFTFSPLLYLDETIGYFAVSKRNRLTEGYEFDFIEQQKHYLWLLALGIMVLVALVSYPLSRHLVKPIRDLASGMRRLTQGDYQSQLTIKRADEFSELASDFNELAHTLLSNEQARKRWIANISHELRTPVAILKGELEAIIDGVRALEMSQIESAHQEVLHLQKLIEDLHALTSADVGGMKYQKQPVELVSFLTQLHQKYVGYALEHDMAVKLKNSLQQCVMAIDETRFCQLFDNLINNCVKYAIDGDTICISLSEDSNNVIITIEDNGIGVDEEHMPNLFEHLYRVESARNRKTGGSGLGLSICKHIVDGHQGTIKARRSTLGGLAVDVILPKEE